MKRMREGDDDVKESAGLQGALHLKANCFRSFDVLQNGVAFYPLKNAVREGEVFGVGGKIDARKRKKVEIEVALRPRAGPADIEIPTAQRSVD